MISDEHISAVTHFSGIDLPTTHLALKKAYREACLRLHPDKGGDEDLFKRMQAAYDLLINTPDVFIDKVAPQACTVDGTPLSKLGLGLGPTTNGRDCPSCNHNGYLTLTEPFYETCAACFGTGEMARTFPCRSCDGTGRFLQRFNGRFVPCRTCDGTGRFKHPRLKEWCVYCFGTGQTPSKNKAERVYYVRCQECGGTGELPLWNPVLPKGALSK